MSKMFGLSSFLWLNLPTIIQKIQVLAIYFLSLTIAATIIEDLDLYSKLKITDKLASKLKNLMILY